MAGEEEEEEEGPARSFRGGEASRSGLPVPIKEVFLPPWLDKSKPNVQCRILGANTLYKKKISYQLGYFTYASPLQAPETINLANSSTALPDACT